MKKNEAFELLELFKSKANHESHLLDAHNGNDAGSVMWAIFNGPQANAQKVATLGFFPVVFDNAGAGVILLHIGNNQHQLADYSLAKGLIDTISY